MKITRGNISNIVTAVAVLLLIAAIPSAVRDAVATGHVYLFSAQFLEDLPRRLTGPGRFRFLAQPLIAILLGWRSGLGDARAGRPAYLYGLLSDEADRKESLRSGLATIRDLVAIAIVLDAGSQLLIYGQLHPGAAVIVGLVLISIPYAVARGLANRLLGIAHR